jgi:hypothetical protein
VIIASRTEGLGTVRYQYQEVTEGTQEESSWAYTPWISSIVFSPCAIKAISIKLLAIPSFHFRCEADLGTLRILGSVGLPSFHLPRETPKAGILDALVWNYFREFSVDEDSPTEGSIEV